MGTWTILATVAAALTAVGSAPETDNFSTKDRKALVKSVRKYYGYLDESLYGKALKEMGEIQETLEKAGDKDEDWEASLALCGDWREILREGYQAESPRVKSATGNFASRPMELSNPLGIREADLKELDKAFNGDLKVFYSFPKRYDKEPMPVIVAMHPTEAEENVKIRDLESSSDIVRRVGDWAEETYPDEIREKAIILVPVLDLASLSADGLHASRARWDSADGALWCFTALRDLVLNEVNHDFRRIFLDGHGEGSLAAMIFCSQYPSMTTGAVIRGPAPQRIEFSNCRNQSFLMVGEESKAFAEKWSAEQGYNVTHVDSIDAATMVGWITDEKNAKNTLPERVDLATDNLRYGAAYWLKISQLARVENLRRAEIRAEVNKEDNSITVTTNKLVAGFSLFLNDDLVDLDREIKVIHKQAGEEEGAIRYQGRKKRVLERLLKEYYYRQHGNGGEVFVESIDIEL